MGGVTAEDLLDLYRAGLFPMADSREDETAYVVDPELRGVFPLDGLHVSRRLARTVRSGRFTVRVDTAFHQVLLACAETTHDRSGTWINGLIEDLCLDLFERGEAHSVEAWRDDRLVGGLYGISIGGAFFGESMFSRERDASKVALVHLAARLVAGGYSLLDTQFLTDHLASLGAQEITRDDYLRRLAKALPLPGNFYALGPDVCGSTALAQLTSQAS